MLLQAALRLLAVQCPHARYVMPDPFRMTARRQRHECAGQRAFGVQAFADAHVLLIVVNVRQAGLGEIAGQHIGREERHLLGGHQAIAAAAPESVRVYLPAGPAVVFLALADWRVGIAAAAVALRFAEQQDVFGAAHAHLGAVLALFAPAQAIGLVVLAHHVRHHGDHAHVVESVPDAVKDGLGVEGADGGRSRAGDVAKQDTVLDVAGVYPARLQHAQQFRSKEVHLRPKVGIVVGMPEVVDRRRVFVVIAEWNGCADQARGVFRHAPGFLHAVVVDRREVRTTHFDALHADGPAQLLRHSGGGQAVLFDDLAHALHHLLMPPPFGLQSFQHLGLGIGVNDMDVAFPLLQEAVNAMDGLNEVVELEADAQKDGYTAVTLKIAARAGKDRFAGEQGEIAVGEAHHPVFALVQIHAAVDVHHSRHGPLDGVALGLLVMPDDAVLAGRGVENVPHLGYARGQTAALDPTGGPQAHGRVVHKLQLAVLVAGLRQTRRHLVIMDVEPGQIISLIGVAQIGRLLQEHGPGVDPQPELALHMRVQGKIVGLGAATFEKAGKGLAGIHDAQKTGVVDQLLVAVGAGCGRGHKAVFDGLEEGEKGLIGQTAERAQHTGFIQRRSVEVLHMQAAVAHGFVIGEVQARAADFLVAPDEGKAHAQLGGVGLEFLPHAQRGDDELEAALLADDLAHDFKLHERLAQAEGREHGATAPQQRPTHDVALVRLEHGVNTVRRDSKAGMLRNGQLGFEEGTVEGIAAHFFSSLFFSFRNIFKPG